MSKRPSARGSSRPNGGRLAALGEFGIAERSDTYAFDVQTTAEGIATAWLVKGSELDRVDLKTGATTETGAMTRTESNIRDIAIMQANTKRQQRLAEPFRQPLESHRRNDGSIKKWKKVRRRH